MTSAADVLLTTLAEGGVEVVFGIPGVDNLAFFEALDRSSMRSILVRHEATAGFAADAYFRISGRPAVCFTTAGPGAANAVTPMGEAWASGSTFLHLTTTAASAYVRLGRPRGLPHYLPDQIDVFGPVSSVALHCDDPNTLSSMANRCLSAMRTPPFAASYLEVPYDLLAAPVEPAPVERPSPPLPISLDATAIREAARLLGMAERPVIWAGSGSVESSAAILRLAERLGAPVVLTHSAKRGFNGMDHPLVLTYPPHEPPIAELLETSDVVLVLGSDLDAMMTRQFALQLPKQLIHVDVAAAHIGMAYPTSCAVIGTVEAAVPAILRGLDAVDGRRTRAGTFGTTRAAEARTATRAGLSGDGRGLMPERFLDALDATIPPDAIVVCDMAVAGYWAAGQLSLAPRRRLLYPIGWGTLGFGLPAAIGAATAAPQSRIVCICGDAGVLYALGDLATVAQERARITLVVVDDGGYGMLRYAAQQRFGRTFAVDLVSPDYPAIARGFGIPAWDCPLDSDDLAGTLARALEVDGPSVVVLHGALVPPRMSILSTPAIVPAAD